MSFPAGRWGLAGFVRVEYSLMLRWGAGAAAEQTCSWIHLHGYTPMITLPFKKRTPHLSSEKFLSWVSAELSRTHSLLTGFILLVRCSMAFTSERIGICDLRKNFLLWRWGWLPIQSQPPCPKRLIRNPVTASCGQISRRQYLPS